MFNFSSLYYNISTSEPEDLGSSGGSGDSSGGGEGDGSRDIWMISDDVIQFVYTFNLAVLCGLLSLFGIAANAINIVVFLRLGFQETINISLFGLAVSDALSLVALLFVSVCYNPFFMYSDLPVFAIELQHYPGGWTHVMFTRVAGFITVYITFERCLCIAFPLKVKAVLTRPKVALVVAGIYVFTIGSMAQNYSAFYIGWRWDPGRNRTMLGMVFRENSATLQLASEYIQMVYPSVSFTSVVVCTCVFVWKLNRRARWLQTAAAGGGGGGPGQEASSGSTSAMSASARRDRQVIKLVVSVAVIFIVCYVPSLLLFTALTSMPEMEIGGKYENFFILVYSIAFPIEAVNSSVNIFVYYRMMSRYKTVLLSICGRHRQ